MTVAQAAGATVGAYTYNALGQRINKVAATTQRFGYNENSQLLDEYGTDNRDYIWLGDLPVAIVDIGTTSSGGTICFSCGPIVGGPTKPLPKATAQVTLPTQSTPNSVVHYVYADELGTPRAVADSSGTVDWLWAYQGNAFGELAPTSSTAYTLNLRFPGQYYDVETGLNYNLNRDYDSSSGRYAQSDPIGLAGGNSTYAAVNNSPLLYVDPTGTNGILLVNPLGAYVPALGGYGGHAAALVGNDQAGYNYYSSNGYDANDVQQYSMQHFDSMAAFENALGSTYPLQTGVVTSAAMDNAMNAWAKQHIKDPYHAIGNNCGNFAKGVLNAGGINVDTNFWGPVEPNLMDVESDNKNSYYPEVPLQGGAPSFNQPTAGSSQ